MRARKGCRDAGCRAPPPAGRAGRPWPCGCGQSAAASRDAIQRHQRAQIVERPNIAAQPRNEDMPGARGQQVAHVALPGLSDPCARVTSKPSGSSAGDSDAAWIAGPPMFSRVITRTTGTRALAVSGLGTFGLDSMPESLSLGRRRLFAASACWRCRCSAPRARCSRRTSICTASTSAPRS